MSAYRLRDVNTNAIARPPREFNPNDFNLEAGWIIEYEVAQPDDSPPRWKIYRQPTSDELRVVRILARLDDIDALVEEIRQEFDGE